MRHPGNCSVRQLDGLIDLFGTCPAGLDELDEHGAQDFVRGQGFEQLADWPRPTPW
jgi:hypothetical protein